MIESVAQLEAEGRYEEAYRLVLRMVSSTPDDPTALACLRDLLTRRRKFEAALSVARRVVKLAPNDGVQWDRLAGLYLCLDRFDDAERAIERALHLSPEQPAHWHQAMLMAYRQNDTERAMRYADEAEKLDPYGLALKHDLAHVMLASGHDLRAALEAYEVRWESLLHLDPWDLHLPEWKGEDLTGKRLLFHSEQGRGDALMMARFAKNLVKLGAAEVGLCVPADLVRLFAVQDWPAVRVVDTARLERNDWDVHSPMFSALRHLAYERTDIDPSPYLTIVPRVIVPPLPSGYRVGICWESGKWNVDTALRRSVPLEMFIGLSELPGVRLVSLQKGEASQDVVRLGMEALVDDPMTACDDFAATAAIVSQLDAVVSVDTAVVHLAAAMGKPTFMLTQFTRCWRWWELPSGLPWYSTLTAAQQRVPRDWSFTIDESIRWLSVSRS